MVPVCGHQARPAGRDPGPPREVGLRPGCPRRGGVARRPPPRERAPGRAGRIRCGPFRPRACLSPCRGRTDRVGGRCPPAPSWPRRRVERCGGYGRNPRVAGADHCCGRPGGRQQGGPPAALVGADTGAVGPCRDHRCAHQRLLRPGQRRLTLLRPAPCLCRTAVRGHGVRLHRAGHRPKVLLRAHLAGHLHQRGNAPGPAAPGRRGQSPRPGGAPAAGSGQLVGRRLTGASSQQPQRAACQPAGGRRGVGQGRSRGLGRRGQACRGRGGCGPRSKPWPSSSQHRQPGSICRAPPRVLRRRSRREGLSRAPSAGEVVPRGEPGGHVLAGGGLDVERSHSEADDPGRAAHAPQGRALVGETDRPTP